MTCTTRPDPRPRARSRRTSRRRRSSPSPGAAASRGMRADRRRGPRGPLDGERLALRSSGRAAPAPPRSARARVARSRLVPLCPHQPVAARPGAGTPAPGRPRGRYEPDPPEPSAPEPFARVAGSARGRLASWAALRVAALRAAGLRAAARAPPRPAPRPACPPRPASARPAWGAPRWTSSSRSASCPTGCSSMASRRWSSAAVVDSGDDVLVEAVDAVLDALQALGDRSHPAREALDVCRRGDVQRPEGHLLGLGPSRAPRRRARDRSVHQRVLEEVLGELAQGVLPGLASRSRRLSFGVGSSMDATYPLPEDRPADSPSTLWSRVLLGGHRSRSGRFKACARPSTPRVRRPRARVLMHHFLPRPPRSVAIRTYAYSVRRVRGGGPDRVAPRVVAEQVVGVAGRRPHLRMTQAAQAAHQPCSQACSWSGSGSSVLPASADTRYVVTLVSGETVQVDVPDGQTVEQVVGGPVLSAAPEAAPAPAPAGARAARRRAILDAPCAARRRPKPSDATPTDEPHRERGSIEGATSTGG